MNKIVDVNEAIIAYLKGKKVRRHITKEEFENSQKIRLESNKRLLNRHTWWENWVWNDGTGKKTSFAFDDSEVLSPIESFEKSGYDKNKLWAIKV